MPDTWDYAKNRPDSAEREHGPAILTPLMVTLCILFTIAFHLTYLGVGKGTWLESVGRFGWLDARAIWDGRYAALLTSVFVHGSPNNLIMTIMHLGFNMMWLLALGTVLEITLNPLQWAMFFIGAAVVGSGAELAASGQTGVGASGVVYAMFGLLWAGRRQIPEWRTVATPHNFNLFVMWGIFCVIGTLAGALQIANAAHGGGFLFGLAVGWLFVDKRPRLRLIGAASLAALLALTILSVTWEPWSYQWCFWKGNEQYKQQRYDSAIDWYRRSMRMGGENPAALTNIALAERLRGNDAAAEAMEKNLQSSGEDSQPSQESR